MYNSIDESLGDLETFVENLDFDTPTMRVMRHARAQLTESWMEPTYRDLFIARATFELSEAMTEEQVVRAITLSRKMVDKFYRAFRQEGYNDQAIAEMGSNFVIRIN